MVFDPNKKINDFIFSFGLMLLGVGLLFVGSVTFVPKTKAWLNLPTSAPRSPLVKSTDVAVALPVSRPLVPAPKDNKNFQEKISAATAVVVDDRTDRELFARDADVPRPLASITKLMSALVILDSPINWNTTTIITDDDIVGGGNLIKVGEKYTAEDLWNIALIGSSNDAVDTLVRLSGYTRDEFVSWMNTKASGWRLGTMHFTDPTGLDSGNVASARQAARLLKIALQQPKIYKTLQTGEYYAHPLNGKTRLVWSTNQLLINWVENDFGAGNVIGKTGYIGDSGYNFVVKLLDNKGHAIRVVVLGASTNQARFSEARDLGHWAFEHYLWPDEPGYQQLGG